MIKKLGQLVIVLLIITSTNGCNSVIFAQNAHDRINLDTPNSKYLEHLIKQKVDSIRVKNKLPSLVNETTLYLASRDHVRYLTQKDDLSHYQQESKRKRTYHERAIKYGAEDYYVSENIGIVKISRRKETLSYNQAANRIVSDWVESNSGVANIIAKSHAIVGIASWYNKDDHEFRVVANFAAVTKDYKPQRDTTYFPFELVNDISPYYLEKPQRKYDWGIGPKPKKSISESYNMLSRKINTLDITVKNDSIFVIFNNVRRVESLFEKRNDGLAIEIIPHTYYSCRNKEILPVRRKEEFTVKGDILEPVYRDYLLENIAAQKRKPKIDLRHIASIPKKYKGKSYSLNLIILKGNRIADIITFNETPTKVFDIAVKAAPAKDSIPSPEVYIPKLRRDTLMLRVFFDQNETYVLPTIGDSIRNWVRDKKIQRSAVYAYASVEGTEKINKRLSEKRAEELIVFFNPSDGKPTSMRKVTRENWFDFFKDIQGSRYEFLTNLDTSQIRRYVSNRLTSREMEPLLARQRFADLKILAWKIVNDVTIDDLAISEYNYLYQQLVYECGNQPIPCQVLDIIPKRLELIHLYLLNRNLMGRVSWKKINQLPIALRTGDFDINTEPLAAIYYNKLRYTLAHRGELLASADSLRVLKELNRFPYPDPIIAYNYFITLIKQQNQNEYQPFYQQQTLSELQNLINRLEQISFDPDIVSQLKLFYHFKNAEKEYFINRLGDFDYLIKPSIDYIAEYYSQHPPAKQMAIDLSMFFSAFKRYDDAQAILEPYVLCNFPCKQSLILYLKYFYANPRVKQNTDFYQLLKDAADILLPTEWCDLFNGKWPINMQLNDHEPIHIMYCRMCGSK
ncbi:MAG: CAP domain-containing protein [Bacteroidales bacterium]|nr:CAP domain-containing protein [Bacteroidales bacterium]